MTQVTNVVDDPRSVPWGAASVIAELIDQNGNRIRGTVTSTGAVVRPKQTLSDALGSWVIDLTPNLQITPSDTMWRISQKAPVGPAIKVNVEVPTAGPVKMATLLKEPPGDVVVSDHVIYATVPVPDCPKNTNTVRYRVWYRTGSTPLPIVYIFNGAGFFHTYGVEDGDALYSVAQDLCEVGPFVAVGIEYHGFNCGLLGDATMTVPYGTVMDASSELCAKAAIAHFRANAATYHADTTKEATLGFSAGGHMAQMLSLFVPGIKAAVGYSSLPSAKELDTSAYAWDHYTQYAGSIDKGSDPFKFSDCYERVATGAPLQFMYNSTNELIPQNCMLNYATLINGLSIPWRTTLVPGDKHAGFYGMKLRATFTRAGTFVYPAPGPGDTGGSDSIHALQTVFA